MSFVAKSQQDLLNDIVPRLTSIGFTDAQYSGTPVRALVDQIAGMIGGFYGDVADGLTNSYLSQATGTSLDAIGALVGCFRRLGEQDGNYRVRISQGWQSKQGATAAAMLNALLQLSNVRDVILQPFTQGAGSLSFYLLPVTAPLSSDTIATAEATLASIAAGGALTIVTTPAPLYLNLTGVQSVALGQQSNGTAASAIAKYIANLSMGSAFIPDQAIAAGLAADSNLLDLTLLTMSSTDSNGNVTELLVQTYTPLFDQELQPGTIALS